MRLGELLSRFLPHIRLSASISGRLSGSVSATTDDERRFPTDDERRWARLEKESLIRRARALDVDVDLGNAGRE